MKILLFISIAFLSLLLSEANAASVIINSQTAGPTPFIVNLQLTANPAASIKSIKFQITPKVGSVTRPVTATYSAAYLQKRGDYNSLTGAILLPVFGLYAGYNNTVALTYTFTDNSSQQANFMMNTPVFTSSCGYTNPTVTQARTSSTTLSYDYIMLKNLCGTYSPVIIDTDGQVRWVGTTGFANLASALFQNSIYILNNTFLYRMELDGTFAQIHDYSSANITNFHHNIDFGKTGMILDADTTTQSESFNLEIDGFGNILKTWDLGAIIGAAITAGGEDASQFVKPVGNDWFHNNAVTYKKSDNSVIVSSRENFVIAVDYSTSAIKWILGDTTKQWFQFQSLRNYALTLDLNTLAPIGQHAVSITKDDNLLLFDDGKSSQYHTPAGADRTYSAPRKYQINTQTKVAKEIWNYPNGQAFYSPFCSSVYEDSSLNYLVDYSYLGNPAPPALFADVLGLDASGTKIFHYRYTTSNCDTSWNAIPIHFEQVVFSSLAAPVVVSRKSHGAAGTFDVPLPLTGSAGVECRSGGANGNHQVIATFASPVTITNATVTPGNGGTAAISGVPIINGNTVTVNLTNVSNAQTLTINLIGVNDGANTENVSVPVGVLAADSTNNHSSNSGDVGMIKSQVGQTVSASTFRSDVTIDGSINSSDVAFAKSKSGSGIP